MIMLQAQLLCFISVITFTTGLLAYPRMGRITTSFTTISRLTSRNNQPHGLCRFLSQTDPHVSEKPASASNHDIDYTALSSDDPLFLDMPWPTESGPESAAFARHMQWKRGLSDGERKIIFNG
jgi:hypothetical protein